MGQGSQLVNILVPLRLKVLSLLHAFLIATISACAVGSFLFVTSLNPSDIISLFFTITHPKGPPSSFKLIIDNSIALNIKFFEKLCIYLFKIVFIFQMQRGSIRRSMFQ